MLIHCPDCGTKVSSESQSCVKCSYPIYKLKNIGQQNQPQPKYKTNSESIGLIIAGYVTAFISLLFFPIIFSIAGVVIGIINITKGSTGHGIAQIALSILFGVIGVIFGVLVALF